MSAFADGRIAPKKPKRSARRPRFTPIGITLCTSRSEVEAEIERLIDMLDRVDGDADCEDADADEANGDDEPWLGGGLANRDPITGQWTLSDLELDDCDLEPSVGVDEADDTAPEWRASRPAKRIGRVKCAL